MHWLFFAGFLVAIYGGLYTVTKLGGPHISPLYFAGIVVVANVIATIVWFSIQWAHGGFTNAHYNKEGVLYAIAAGILVTGLNYGWFKLFAAGAPVSVGHPFVNILSMILLVVIGLVLFKEHMSWLKGLGFMMAIGGVILVARY